MKKRLIIIISSIILPSVLAFGGGQDLGGGDTSSKEPVTIEQISSTVLRYHNNSEYLLNFIQLAGLVSQRILNIEFKLSQPLPEVEKKDLLQQARIFHRMFDIKERQIKKINVILSEACFDRSNEERDGTAGVYDENTICFNSQRLSSKLTKENFELELLGLYVHELSHLYGTNEEEAMSLHRQIIGIGPNFKKYLNFLFEETNIRSEINIILGLIRSGPDCEKLYEIKNRMLSLYRSSSLDSADISTLSFNQIINFHSAFVISQYITDFCDQSTSLVHKSKFVVDSPISMTMMYPDPILVLSFLGHDKSLQFSQYLLADLGIEKIQWLPYGDKSKLKENLQQIERLLQYEKSF